MMSIARNIFESGKMEQGKTEKDKWKLNLILIAYIDLENKL